VNGSDRHLLALQHRLRFRAPRDLFQEPLGRPAVHVGNALEKGREIAVEEHSDADLRLQEQRARVVEKHRFERARRGPRVREQTLPRVV